jgi:hypothetical protein
VPRPCEGTHEAVKQSVVCTAAVQPDLYGFLLLASGESDKYAIR